MQREFDDQVAVVTGAARGLGRAVATMLAERGATVYLVDFNRPALEATVSALSDDGLSVRGSCADIANEEELAALRHEIVRTDGGRLDILVNNAGGWRHGHAREISLTDWEWTLRTNLTGTFLATRTLMDLMTERGYGRIVNVASTDAHRPKPALPHYAAAKAALISLTKSFAEELAPSGVLVNAVSPGAIATEAAKEQSWFAERAKAVPLGRAAEPEDIAEVILFLASPRNRFMVGEAVKVNGGLFIS